MHRPTVVTRTPDPAPAVVRWLAAGIAVLYGFAKINGAQFTVLDSELAKPMGEVSGFWLTWYYFSYSPVYGNLIAGVQVVGGLLLTAPRFSLAGGLLLLPVALNIVLIDIFYGIAGGLFAGLVLLALVLWIMLPHTRRLLDAVVLPRMPSTGRLRMWGVRFARVALVVWAFVFSWRTAHYNNRNPTPIDGVWNATSAVSSPPVETAFFEYNRAHMVVLRDSAGGWSRHHFEVEPDGTVRIWETWLEKGALLWEGTYAAEAGVITLRSADGEGRLRLRRAADS